MSERHAERNVEIRRLTAEGLTPRQVGERLGISRCAVIGTLHRHGRPEGATKVRAGRRRPAETEGLVAIGAGIGHIRRWSEIGPMPRACQYITGDERPWRYCGAEAERGSPYCPEHRARCYQGPGREGEK